LEQGQSAVTLSAGGPITEVGHLYIPLPLLSLSYHRGIRNDKLDWESGLHITQLLYGILHCDAGLNYRPWHSDRWYPGAIITPKIFFMTDFSPSSVRVYPDLSLTFPWRLYQNFYIYTGIENFFECSSTREDGNTQKNHWLIAPFAGMDIGNDRALFQLELKVYTPNLENTGRATKNIGFDDHGIFGVFLGWNYLFGKRGQ
jgi:hypothetical protein